MRTSLSSSFSPPLSLVLALLSLILSESSYALSPERVVVLFNSELPASVQIAQHYQSARQIPANNLIGLPVTQNGALSVKDYLETIETPLKAQLDARKLWTRSSIGRVKDCAVDLIVTIYGVPFKTSHTLIPESTAPDGTLVPARMPSGFEVDGASVDSELSMLKTRDYQRKGALRSPYYQSTTRYTELREKEFLLVGRIDGPSPEICHRMIKDAVETERLGLFGKTYLDYAYKGGGYDIGDEWLRTIHRQNRKYGIPTVQEKTSQVMVENYPLKEAALYFGWYSHHFSGPFRNAQLQLKKGSIITHLHSFSASNLRAADQNWTGPILQLGAAATLGNVHEPFLQFSHNFQEFHNRLLKGWSLVEAAYAAHPALSWQGVVLGDPLYRPFLNTRKQKPSDPIDAEYYQLRNIGLIASHKQFAQLKSLAVKQQSPHLFEALALAYLEGKNHKKALKYFKLAERYALDPAHKILQIIHQADYYRAHEQKEKALTLLQAHQIGYEDVPEHRALLALKTLLTPPPAPPQKEGE